MSEVTISLGDPSESTPPTIGCATTWWELRKTAAQHRPFIILRGEFVPNGTCFQLFLRAVLLPQSSIDAELEAEGARLVYHASSRQLMELIHSERLRQIRP